MRLIGVTDIILCVLLSALPIATAASEQAYSSQFMQTELQRAQTAPDHVVTIAVQQPPSVVFDAMLARLHEYNDDVAGVEFDHSNSITPGSLNVGTVRRVAMTNGQELVQRLLIVDAPTTFAYFTDMTLSTASVPIDYSIGFYEFSALDTTSTQARISVAYKPSSRLTALLVRIGFKRALEREFESAARFLNSTTQP